ncbi:WavE lipopolysaccharide synthesis family protein [Pseudomonas sp. BC42]|uniref:WavE lipopolysaccharide synthesis family protein n=1 Tax=Pseudomonas sp. BC42 TaxID=2933816 RepID=UPI001F492139|nr:WavE lipopolysaccharide synthesis family protein [Pseudomonas sp. BC42]ULT71495.1 WavE lipopolysaccharide synthesis family protein [Pseudomonas sp. BC42]
MKASPINSGNISVVVQGPIVPELTNLCLKSIKTYLPDAQVVISTWSDPGFSDSLFDKAVLNNDPGGLVSHVHQNMMDNTNRQIVSTFSGINACDREYILKIRSDIVLRSNNFLNFYKKFPCRNPQHSLFSERVLVPACYSRKYYGASKRKPVVFHPGDWIYFGLRKDIYSLFDIPLKTESDQQYFDGRFHELTGDPWPEHVWRHPPEQWIFLQFVKKFMQIDFKHKNDNVESLALLSESIFANNFISIDQGQWRFDMPKYEFKQWRLSNDEWHGLYRHIVWLKDYKKFSNGTYGLLEGAVSLDSILHYAYEKLGSVRRML